MSNAVRRCKASKKKACGRREKVRGEYTTIGYMRGKGRVRISIDENDAHHNNRPACSKVSMSQ